MADLQFAGITANQVLTKLTDAHVTEYEAKRFVAGWVWENAFGVGRRFDFTRPFAAVDPAPVPVPFAREFQHTDWVDGESAVKAGQTPTEQGFNDRFHRIERDLDRLGALEAACQRYGEPPPGVRADGACFALRIRRGPWMIVGVRSAGADDRDGRPCSAQAGTAATSSAVGVRSAA